MMKGRITCADFFRPHPNKVVLKHQDEIRKAGYGVDPAIIAHKLGLQIRTVEMVQRKLGLRKCRSSNRKKGLFD